MFKVKTYTKSTLIDELKAIRNRGWIPSSRNKKNAGALGNTLEDLLGIQENNLPLPNAAEWELKTQRKNTDALLTLFHMEPSSRALKIVPYLLNIYGWRHEQAGNKYPETERSFRQTLVYRQKTNRGFYVDIDDINKRVVVNFSFNDIDKSLTAWKNSIISRGGITLNASYTPYWGFNDVFYKAGIKLRNCFYIVADEKTINNQLYFRYLDIMMLSGFSLEKFINAIKDGQILVDFDARTGHNHGTKFRIRPKAIPQLYEKVIQF